MTAIDPCSGVYMAGFRPDVNEAMRDAVAQASGLKRPVAVFDFDNTCIVGDIGELYSYYLIDEMLYRWDLDAFWELIDPLDGRDTIRSLVNEIMALPEEARRTSPAYATYRSELGSVYSRRLERDGKRSCYSWAVLLHVGLQEHEMTTFSDRAIRSELASPLHMERFETLRGEAVSVRRGVRRLREINEWMRSLESAGIEVWVVSASNWWTVSTFAAHFGIPPERVVGNRVHVNAGVLSDQLVEPALFREGKVAVIEREIGVRPAIVAGDSETDHDMLEWASHLALVIDSGLSPEFVTMARERGWPVQPQGELTAEGSQ